MTGSETDKEASLHRFIREFPDDHACLLELLRFLCQHPCAQFNQTAIVDAFDVRKPQVEKALDYLVSKGVVSNLIRNDAALYSLTDAEPLRGQVLNLAGFDWCQWQAKLGQINNTRQGEVYA